MLLDHFVEQSISDIRSGVTKFNDKNDILQAEMPRDIEYEVFVVRLDGSLFMYEPGMAGEKQKISFKINILECLPGQRLYKNVAIK